MTAKERKALERAKKQLEKCGGDCKHCEKCHFYFANTERVLYMAVVVICCRLKCFRVLRIFLPNYTLPLLKR